MLQSEFENWLGKQKKIFGNDFRKKAIVEYSNALLDTDNKTVSRLIGLANPLKFTNLFNYECPEEFSEVNKMIRKATNYKKVNKEYINGGFSVALNRYEEFLKCKYELFSSIIAEELYC